VASSSSIFNTFFKAIVMFRNAVMCGKRLKAWKTIPMCERTSFKLQRTSVMSIPSKVILPSVGSSSMFIIRSIVDFPEPDGPITTRTSPSTQFTIRIAGRHTHRYPRAVKMR
jgi:hypothetical protein